MNRMKVGGGFRLMIETPCEIGDRIWTVENGNVMRCMCQGFKVRTDGVVEVLGLYDIPYEIGVNCFLSEEEAREHGGELCICGSL